MRRAAYRYRGRRNLLNLFSSIVPVCKGWDSKERLFRMAATAKTRLVQPIAQLETRYLTTHTCLAELLVTCGSHVTHAILCERDRLSKHVWQRARMGLRGGVRDCFSTVSTTVHQSLNAVLCVKSGIMLQHGHRWAIGCDRYVIAFILWSQHACTAARSAFAPICIGS